MTCECCGLTYDEFRTGLSFGEVAGMLWVDNPDPTTWRQKTRHTVLGKWREIKLGMWREHLKMCRPLTQDEMRRCDQEVVAY